MVKNLVSTLASIVFILLTACSAKADDVITLSHGGKQRTFILHVPVSYKGNVSVPLVLNFHGYTSSALQQGLFSGWRDKSIKERFIIAWPQGIGDSWNAGAGCCGSALNQGLDDVDFARSVVAHIQASHKIDERRIYATGFSNGGALTQRLAVEATDLFAAAAGVAGMLLVPAQPKRPMPIINFHGYRDVTVPYAGNDVFPAAQVTLKKWSEANQCAGAPITLALSGTGKCESYLSCKDDVEVSLCSLEGEHVLYLNDRNIKIPDRAWAFLSRFSLVNGVSTTSIPRRDRPTTATSTPPWSVWFLDYQVDGRQIQGAILPSTH